ncbi:MAG: hypothetical protein IJ760_01900 [Bacteroidales bacterium]|nr:hypothetical protein [Bacteroidales bacterium]
MKKAVTLAALAAVLAVMMAACEPDNPKPVDTTRGEEPVPQPDNGYAELIVGKWHESLFNGWAYSYQVTWEFLSDGTYLFHDPDPNPLYYDSTVTFSYYIVGDSLIITSPTPGYGSRNRILELTETHLQVSYFESILGYECTYDFDRVSE